MQVFLGHSGGLDTDGNELPRLVYVSREKRPGFQHHKKAGAMNALVCDTEAYLTIQFLRSSITFSSFLLCSSLASSNFLGCALLERHIENKACLLTWVYLI